MSTASDLALITAAAVAGLDRAKRDALEVGQSLYTVTTPAGEHVANFAVLERARAAIRGTDNVLHYSQEVCEQYRNDVLETRALAASLSYDGHFRAWHITFTLPDTERETAFRVVRARGEAEACAIVRELIPESEIVDAFKLE